jgi:hypothetical protein
MKMKGFGPLGWQVNYYGFHSVVGLIRKFGRKHKQDKGFEENLKKVGEYCGACYINPID